MTLPNNGKSLAKYAIPLQNYLAFQVSNMPELLSGGDMLIRALQDEGVEYIFGYPGGAALHIYDAIFKQQKIEHILVRHEQAATHMADGYARATGKPGVVLVTSGPGATNAVTGIATAFMDSSPIIVISGQVPSNLIGTDAFQETDMIGVSRPVVKHSFMVPSAVSIPSIIKRAFYLAKTGRPGPVVVDVPKDTTDPGVTAPYEYPSSVSLRSYNPSIKGNHRQVARAVELMLDARRPVFYVGGGAIHGNAPELLRILARRLEFPVTSTLMGLGAFPASDPLWLGMLGMHGTYEANHAMHNSDCVIAIGARFDDRVTNDPRKFCKGASIIHVDVDPTSISKIVRADVPVVGSAEAVLRQMLDEVDKRLARAPERIDRDAIYDWHGRIGQWRDTYGLDKDVRLAQEANQILPQQAVRALARVAPKDAYVTSDVGQHQMFVAQHFPFETPRRWINSGGLGTMGFGLPAAMGIQFAQSDASVICVTGEGSFMMNLQELSTCLQYALPIKIICLNNQALGMVKQWQDMQYGGRHSHSTYQDSLPDFVALAESFGHVGIRVSRISELEPALERTLSPELKNKLVFVDVLVDPTEHVYPMAIKGGAMCDMYLSKSEETRAEPE